MKHELLCVRGGDDFFSGLDSEVDDDIRVRVVEDVEEAVEVLSGGRVDCVLCDVDGAEGERAVDVVGDSHPDVPLIAVSEDASRMEMVDDGVVDCFVKSHPIEVLESRIDGYVDRGFEAGVLEELIDNVPSGVLVVDENRTVTLANQMFLDIWSLGEDPRDVVGIEDKSAMEKATDLLENPDEWMEETESRIRDDVEGGRDEFELVDGTVVERIYVPLEAGGGEHDLWVFRDVTRHRKRERQLTGLHGATRELIDADNRQEVYEVLVETAEDVLDYDTVAVYEPADDGDDLVPMAFNERSLEVFDEVPEVSRDSFFGEALERGELLVEDDVRRHEAVHNPNTPVRAEVAVPVGEYGVLASGSTEVGSYENRDVTFLEILAANARSALGRLEQEREIEEREEWYSALIETSNDMITVLGPDGTIKYQSPSVERILGYGPEEMVGTNTFDYVHPDDRDRVLEEFMNGFQKPGLHETKVEYRYRAKDGSWRWLESLGNNRLGDPVVQGGVVNSRDVTERKRQERELERQKERLEEFASVVSHDLRNPLNVVAGRLDLALDTGEFEHVEAARDAAERMDSLVEGLLELARAGAVVSDSEEAKLDDVAREAWSNVPSGDGELEASEGFVVEADFDRLVQVFENLFRNSLEHGVEDDGGDGSLSIAVGELPEEDGFYVEDDGVGLSENARERAFEHGYTEGEGSGLGLSIVEEIAEAHGWRVEAGESDEGGARFEFHVEG